MLKLNKNNVIQVITKVSIQIQHLLKLNGCIGKAQNKLSTIQIQHLLKLNEILSIIAATSLYNSNTTLVKVKSTGLDGDKLQKANSNTTLVKDKSIYNKAIATMKPYSNTTLVKVKSVR